MTPTSHWSTMTGRLGLAWLLPQQYQRLLHVLGPLQLPSSNATGMLKGSALRTAWQVHVATPRQGSNSWHLCIGTLLSLALAQLPVLQHPPLPSTPP